MVNSEQSDLPVSDWIPLDIPVLREIEENEERMVDEFITKLMRDGHCELGSENFNGKKLVVVLREAGNPFHKQEEVDMDTFVDSRGFELGFTSAFVVDLLEEEPVGSKNFRPVGHRDYKIVKFVSGNVVANGNFGISRRLFSNNVDPLYKEGLKLADEEFGDMSRNGIDIVPSWRGMKLGNLLMGISVGILKKSGVKAIDLGAGVSESLAPIVKKLGYTGNRDMFEMTFVSQKTITDFVYPFIK